MSSLQNCRMYIYVFQNMPPEVKYKVFNLIWRLSHQYVIVKLIKQKQSCGQHACHKSSAAGLYRKVPHTILNRTVASRNITRTFNKTCELTITGLFIRNRSTLCQRIWYGLHVASWNMGGCRICPNKANCAMLAVYDISDLVFAWFETTMLHSDAITIGTILARFGNGVWGTRDQTAITLRH